MKCHYEVLNVSMDADDAEIKTSYRKLALKWHPDKNLDNSDFAKEQFQFVQQAYEVLSDRQERAWYDKHREQILYGANSDFQDESLDLFQYFTTTCFKGYGDDEQGFYTIYRNVFDKIAQEDMDYMEKKEEFCNIPSFGNSKTDFENLAEFYAHWTAYSTKKSYVWLDPYDIKDIKDRRYIKLVEKENKKIRQKAKKERNEEVRSLVAFIKKRDKRVQAQKKFQEQKLLNDKKKREELSKQKRLERQKLLNESVEQPAWAKFDNVKSELEEIEKSLAEEFGEELSNSESEEEEESLNNLYCVACNKVFKTPKAFQNHESSKKHKENVEYLKSVLLEEDLEKESNISDNIDDYIESGNENSDIEEQIADSVKQDVASESEEIDLDDIEEVTVKSKRKKKPKNVIVVDENLPHNDLETSSLEEDFNFEDDKKQKKRSKKNSNKTQSKQKNMNGDNETDEVITEKEIIKQTKNKEKKGKSIQPNEVHDVDIHHNCITCKSTFPSKNKLFSHLKKTGHGVYIPTNVKNKRKQDIQEK